MQAGHTMTDTKRSAAVDCARKEVEDMFENSNLKDLSDEFPKFTMEELNLGKILGKEGVFRVNEVRGFSVDGIKQEKPKRGKEKDDQVSDGELESREFIAKHCLRNGGNARYAVKYIAKDKILGEDLSVYTQVIKDLAIETRFLSSVLHPNIIKLRATSNLDRFHKDYFIVMDKLYDTLDKRLVKWQKANKGTQGLVGKLADHNGKKANKLMEERLVAAFDLSAAIEYLHNQRIVYRDIKPENVGFDVRGDIKVFDFGLAKEVHPELKNRNDDTYNLTGFTGSIRYMAPEVALCKPYNFTADTYSFCILLWQMLALKKPFATYGMASFATLVHRQGGTRPLVREGWPVLIKNLLTSGWSEDIADRPSMEEVTQILKKEIIRLRFGNDAGLEHQQRRSTFVLEQTK